MKLGSLIHLEELRSTLCSILSLDLLFSSPELKASGELIVRFYGSSVRSPSTLSNDFSSESTGPNVTKFHM